MVDVSFSKKASDPSLKDLLDLHKRDVLLSMNCHHLGTVDSFDSAKQTITATINYKKTFIQYDETSKAQKVTYQDYPILIDCPIVIMKGGNSYITFPVQKGDTCLLLFNDRDMDKWFAGGEKMPPATPRLHSFSDAIALVGLGNEANLISEYSTDKVMLKYDTTGVGVGEKIKLFNSSDTLNDLLQDLVDAVKDLVTATAAITVTCTAPSSPSSVPINVATINLVTTKLSTCAEKLGGLLE